jgi:hypothetical protein
MNGIHPESIHHRFIHCPQAIAIWEFLETILKRHIPQNEKLFGSAEINPFEDAFIALGQFTIWHHRNLVINRKPEDMRKGNPSPNQALDMLKHKLKVFLKDASFWVSLLNNNNSSLYHPEKALSMHKTLSAFWSGIDSIHLEGMETSIPAGS